MNIYTVKMWLCNGKLDLNYLFPILVSLQWTQKRQEAAERRKRAEAERLKNNITDLPNDGPQHTDSKAEQDLPQNLSEADGDRKLQVKSVDLSNEVVGNEGAK